MNAPDRSLAVAIGCLAVALIALLVCLLWLTPTTMSLFLGGGLPVGLVGLAAYARCVVRDLRRRGAL